MVPAVFDQTTADIQAGRGTFRATGQILKFPGYLAVYGQEAEQPQEEAGAEKMEVEDEEKGDVPRQLPPLEAGQKLQLVQIIPEQHFTQPPPRFTEASLVKELEDKGIGRPSTYAAILSTIQDKEYVEKKENRFYPTELGKIVTELLLSAFPRVMDVQFTAKMEEEVDEVEEVNANWVKLLTDFYTPFKLTLAAAEEQMRDVKREEKPTDLVCEKCASPMVIKWGRMGRCLACSDYPTCKTTKPITLKGVVCPDDGGGLAERKSRFGKSFYGCVNYPNCKFAAWDRPIPGPCPQCGKPYLLAKYTKRDGAFIACPDQECGYRREGSG